LGDSPGGGTPVTVSGDRYAGALNTASAAERGKIPPAIAQNGSAIGVVEAMKKYALNR